MSQNRIYCYDPQGLAVRGYLEDFLQRTMGPQEFVRIHDGNLERLNGLMCGVFVEIPNHPCRLPAHLDEALRVRGFVRWTIDDSAAHNRIQETERRNGRF